MPEKPLLLSSARSGVIVSPNSGGSALLQSLAILAGIAVVLFGAWDISTRLASALGHEAGITAFAPAIVALDPGILSAARGSPATTTSPFIPTRLSIPSIGVSAAVEQVGVKDNGSMANPSGFTTVGWYKLGAKAGEAGNAVIAGHVNNGLGLSGVFARLTELPIGERIVVKGNGGEELTYVVIKKTQYAATDAPLGEIFTIQGPSQLVLITCEGDWDAQSRSFDKRLIVVARPVL